MTDLNDLKFAPTHEWARREGNRVIVGISDDAQRNLSDVIHVEMPEPDEQHHYEAGEEIGVIESLKISVDFHAPVSGTITSINAELLSNPELINEDPFGAGWLVEMRPDDPEDVDRLMDVDEYEGSLPEEDEE